MQFNHLNLLPNFPSLFFYASDSLRCLKCFLGHVKYGTSVSIFIFLEARPISKKIALFSFPLLFALGL